MANVAAAGLADRSLREIASAIGSSHRMLIYHFKDRAGLVAALVAAMEHQQQVLLADIARQARSSSDIVRHQWAALTAPEALPFVRLFYELASAAAQRRPGTEAFTRDFVEPWLSAGRAAAQAVGVAVDDASLRAGVALMRGLLLDVVVTGDVAGASAALESHLRLHESRTA